MAALGRFVLAGKEKLCLIRPMGDALALETLFLARGRLVPRRDRRGGRPASEVKKPELELAKQIIASLEGEFDPEALRSEYRESLRELLEAKLEGVEITAPEPDDAQAPVVDLMEALRASVAAAKESEPAGTEEGGAAQAQRRLPLSIAYG